VLDHPDKDIRTGAAAAPAVSNQQAGGRRSGAARPTNRLLVWTLRSLAGQPQTRGGWRQEAAALSVQLDAQEPLARTIERRCAELPVLHDRRLPGTQAGIDHIAFAASGVYVIDSKRCRGNVRTPRSGPSQLLIGERDHTPLIAKMSRQLAAVLTALESIGEEVPVHGCVCLIAPQGAPGAVKLPLLRTPSVEGIALYSPRRLTRRLNRRGPISLERAQALHSELAMRLPAALPPP
jgi:hypothetical protein